MGVYEDCNSLNGKISKELKTCEAQLRRMQAGVETSLDPKQKSGAGQIGQHMLGLCKKLGALYKAWLGLTNRYRNVLTGYELDKAKIRKAEKAFEKMETKVYETCLEIEKNTEPYVAAVKDGQVDQETHKKATKLVRKTGHDFYVTKKDIGYRTRLLSKSGRLMKNARVKFKGVKAKK